MKMAIGIGLLLGKAQKTYFRGSISRSNLYTRFWSIMTYVKLHIFQTQSFRERFYDKFKNFRHASQNFSKLLVSKFLASHLKTREALVAAPICKHVAEGVRHAKPKGNSMVTEVGNCLYFGPAGRWADLLVQGIPCTRIFSIPVRPYRKKNKAIL